MPSFHQSMLLYISEGIKVLRKYSEFGIHVLIKIVTDKTNQAF